MNIDTKNIGPFRITDNGRGTVTLFDTRTQTTVNMRRTLASIVHEARESSTMSGYQARLVELLEIEFNPCV